MVVKKKNIGKIIESQAELLSCVLNKEWIVWTSNKKQYNSAVARAFVNRTFLEVYGLLKKEQVFKYKKNK